MSDIWGEPSVGTFCEILARKKLLPVEVISSMKAEMLMREKKMNSTLEVLKQTEKARDEACLDCERMRDILYRKQSAYFFPQDWKAAFVSLLLLALCAGLAGASDFIVLSVVPPTNFVPQFTTNIAAPVWIDLPSHFGSTTLFKSMFEAYRPSPLYAQNLAWDACSDPAVIGYKVYARTQEGIYGEGFDCGTNLFDTFYGLTPGTNCYAVTSYSATEESDHSKEVSGMPQPVTQPLAVFFRASAPVKTAIRVNQQ